MAVRTEIWPNGTPNWVDLSTRDLSGTVLFYTALFGWEFASAGEGAGGYLLAVKEGRHVAGIGPAQAEHQPAAWTTYFAHDDIDGLVPRIEKAGGTILLPPMDVLSAGRMLIAAGSDGAVFGVWQAKEHIGAERVNEHGALAWNEMQTRDLAATKTFLSDVFGHTFEDIASDGFDYITFTAGAGPVGGVQVMDERMPKDTPNHWLTWFSSDDVDSAAETAVVYGGSVLVGPLDSPVGRMAVLAGTQGETFGVITVTGSGDAAGA